MRGEILGLSLNVETTAPFALTADDVQQRKAYLHITPEDERRLRSVHPVLRARAPEIVDRFYQYLASHEHTRRVLSDPTVLGRLKELQARYFDELTAGSYDLAYCENRVRVGLAHQRIGLSPEWYLGAYLRYLHLASDVLRSSFGPDEERYSQTIMSLTKIMYLDMGLALDAYHFSAQHRLKQESEALARSNEELLKLQAAKQQLSDMIVHDLQNPLTGISAALQILKSAPMAPPPEILEEALRRCKELSLMILNVLEVSRAATGELQLCVENVELVGLISEAVADFQAAAALEGRTIAVEGAGPIPHRTDITLVRRILQNLLRNALRHTPKGTQVTVSVGMDASGAPEVAVADEGPGIAPELQARLFEPFGASALRASGLRVDTGLGLPACRVMARALGGALRIESDGRRGSVFRLSLSSGDPP